MAGEIRYYDMTEGRWFESPTDVPVDHPLQAAIAWYATPRPAPWDSKPTRVLYNSTEHMYIVEGYRVPAGYFKQSLAGITNRLAYQHLLYIWAELQPLEDEFDVCRWAMIAGDDIDVCFSSYFHVLEPIVTVDESETHLLAPEIKADAIDELLTRLRADIANDVGHEASVLRYDRIMQTGAIQRLLHVVGIEPNKDDPAVAQIEAVVDALMDLRVALLDRLQSRGLEAPGNLRSELLTLLRAE